MIFDSLYVTQKVHHIFFFVKKSSFDLWKPTL